MQGRAHIVFGVSGQELVWDAPEGRPSSVTDVQVFPMGAGDEGTEEVATSGAASIDSVNTTVDQASGYGQADPRKLYLSSTANIAVGRNYLVTDDDSLVSEWVHIVALSPGDHVVCRDPLSNAYSVGATFVGTRLTIAVDATWVADENNLSDDQDAFPGYRVRWTYVVAGATKVWASDFDLVRYTGGHTATLADADDEFPGVRQRLPALHQVDEGRRLLNRAHDQLRWDLVDVDLEAARVRSIDAINRAVILRFGVLLARAAVMAGQTDPAALADAQEQYDAFVNRTFRAGPKVPIATDTTGAGGSAPKSNFWRPR